MGALILPSQFTRQPPEAVQLASTGGVRRPIAAFIPTLSGLHIYAEAKHDLYGKPTGSGVKLTPSSYGIASKGVSPSTDTIRLNAAANQLDTVWEKPATQVTVVIVFQRFGNPAGVSPIFGNQCPNNQPFTAWGLLDTPAGTARFEIALNGANADPVMVQATSPIPNNVPVVLIGRYDGSKVDLWQNGSKIAAVNATGSISYPNAADRGPSVGNFYNFTGSNRSALMEVYGGALWDRAISDAELISLSQNPWQLFAAPPRRLWVSTATVVGASLTGAASAQTNAAGTLNTAIRLAASGNVVSSATGALSTAVQLSSAPSVVSSASGLLLTSLPLTSLATATASANAALTGGAAQLSATAAASASSTAQLTTQVKLAATATASATMTASFSFAGAQLSAAPSASTNASAALTTATAMTGAAIAQASASATLAGQGQALAATASARTSASAALTTSISVTAVAKAEASGQAALSTRIALVAIAAARASAAGEMSTRSQIDASMISPENIVSFSGRSRVVTFVGRSRIVRF